MKVNKKIAQCRYCTNSSNEGEGIWLLSRDGIWICMPCFEAFRTEKARSESK